jgi:hypothetical protein
VEIQPAPIFAHDIHRELALEGLVEYDLLRVSRRERGDGAREVRLRSETLGRVFFERP